MTQTALEPRVRVIPATRPISQTRSETGGKKRVAAYCRVSTDSEEQANSYEAQKRYYQQKIAETPDWELAGIYADRGITGTSMRKREYFNQMLRACRQGKIDLIVTKSLSRFARNTVDCLETVRMLKANGIGVLFEKENINTLTESSEFLITLFSGFAQAESESLSKNIVWGRQKSMEAGHVPFQYNRLLGYRKGPDGRPEIEFQGAETVRRIYRRYLDGASLDQIQQELIADNIPTAAGVQKWSKQVIRNILTNEKYIGDALLQKTFVTDCISKRVKKNRGERAMYYVENNHPAIIPREVFTAVREEMTRRAGKRKVLQKRGKTEQGKYSAKYALSELLVCGECGSPYKRCTWTRKGAKQIVWRCVSRLEFGTKYCHTSPTLKEEELHTAVLSALNEFAGSQEEIRDAVLSIALAAQGRDVTEGISLLDVKRRLTEVTQEQTSLLDTILADMDNPELNARLRQLAEEKQKLKEQISQLKQDEQYQAAQDLRRERMRAYLRAHPCGFQTYSDEIVRMAVERVTVVDAGTIRVRFRGCEVEIEREL